MSSCSQMFFVLLYDDLCRVVVFGNYYSIFFFNLSFSNLVHFYRIGVHMALIFMCTDFFLVCFFIGEEFTGLGLLKDAWFS